MRPVLDSKGVITVLPEEGLDIPIAEKNPVTEAVLDISGRNMAFLISGGFKKTLVPDPNNALGLRIVVTPIEIRTNLPESGAPWLLVDYSGTVPVTLYSGTIVWGVSGWVS